MRNTLLSKFVLFYLLLFNINGLLSADNPTSIVCPSTPSRPTFVMLTDSSPKSPNPKAPRTEEIENENRQRSLSSTSTIVHGGHLKELYSGFRTPRTLNSLLGVREESSSDHVSRALSYDNSENSTPLQQLNVNGVRRIREKKAAERLPRIRWTNCNTGTKQCFVESVGGCITVSVMVSKFGSNRGAYIVSLRRGEKVQTQTISFSRLEEATRYVRNNIMFLKQSFEHQEHRPLSSVSPSLSRSLSHDLYS